MENKIIDVNELMERVQDDKELLLELLDIYSADFQEKRKLLNGVVEQNDFEQLKSIAHSLKGASGNISAHVLRETFLKFEELAKVEDMAGVSELFSTLDSQFEELKQDAENIKTEFSA